MNGADAVAKEIGRPEYLFCSASILFAYLFRSIISGVQILCHNGSCAGNKAATTWAAVLYPLIWKFQWIQWDFSEYIGLYSVKSYALMESPMQSALYVNLLCQQLISLLFIATWHPQILHNTCPLHWSEWKLLASPIRRNSVDTCSAKLPVW